MSYEAPLIAPHWNETRKRDILTAAHPFSVYKGFTIVKLESVPPKYYAEKGKQKTGLRSSVEEVHRDILGMKA
jgi:hypothetical protein